MIGPQVSITSARAASALWKPYSYIKGDWPHLDRITEPAVLRAELASVRAEYNTRRLHAGIGYVTRMTSTRAAAPPSARPAASASDAPAGYESPTTALNARSRRERRAHHGQPRCPPDRHHQQSEDGLSRPPDRAQRSWPRSGALDRPPQRSYP